MQELTSQSSLMCLANVVWISVREQLSLPLEMSIKSCSEYMSSFSTKCCRSCSWQIKTTVNTVDTKGSLYHKIHAGNLPTLRPIPALLSYPRGQQTSWYQSPKNKYKFYSHKSSSNNFKQMLIHNKFGNISMNIHTELEHCNVSDSSPRPPHGDTVVTSYLLVT